MSYPTDRAMLFDRSMNPLPELSPSEVYSRLRAEEINGEHALVMVTTRRLEEGWRMLTVDGTGRWREWVVTEPDEDHSAGRNALGTYRFVWSLQYDLTRSYSHTHAEVGYGDCPKTAQEAAAIVLQDVPFWTVGACDGAAISSGEGCVFIYESAWSRLSKLVELTGWEVDSTITVSPLYGVTARQLHLLAHVGSEEATRRFEWDADLTSIRRTPDPGPYYCRVVPLGKGETEYAEDDETTFEWPLDITEETGTEENPGPYYIEDAEAAAVFRYADGNGGWVYPAVAVEYDEDDPELLLNAAMDDLHSHTRPGVTYEASVLQLEQAGMGAHGISLGDDIQCVDLGFNPDAALRIQGRVIKMEVDELSPSTTAEVTIGQLRDSMNGVLSTMAQSLDALNANTSRIRDTLSHFDTARYVKDLLSRINSEIAATGGYTYLTEGEGLITYDIAVDDPLIGYNSTADAWATQVVQIKGGSIRIANSKHVGFQGIDDWDWKTVFTSGHILSELITAVAITSGYIGDATNSNYWNLDTGELVLRLQTERSPETSNVTEEVTTHHGIITVASAGDYEDIYTSGSASSPYSVNYIPGLMVSYQILNSGLTGGYLMLIPGRNTDYWSSLISNGKLQLLSGYGGTTYSWVRMTPTSVRIGIEDQNNYLTRNQLAMTQTGWAFGTPLDDVLAYDQTTGLAASKPFTFNDEVKFRDDVSVLSSSFKLGSDVLDYAPDNYPSSGYVRIKKLYVGSVGGYSYGYSDGEIYCGRVMVGRSGDTNLASHFYGDLYTHGSKSRAADTDDYGTRLLYCYETPSPMFGDLGSGTLDSDGCCYVSIDDVFSETTHTENGYQVFLQKCGPGDLWVAEKHPSYFVVQGTPNLDFDWEVKGQQIGYENLRLDDCERHNDMSDVPNELMQTVSNTASVYDGELDEEAERTEDIESQYDDYVATIEGLYDDELAA